MFLSIVEFIPLLFSHSPCSTPPVFFLKSSAFFGKILFKFPADWSACFCNVVLGVSVSPIRKSASFSLVSSFALFIELTKPSRTSSVAFGTFFDICSTTSPVIFLPSKPPNTSKATLPKFKAVLIIL